MPNFDDTLSVSPSTNGSAAEMPDGKLTYPLSASSTPTDSDGSTLAQTVNVTPTADDANTLRAGPGQPFDSLGEAIAASKPGDTILLEAGVYESDYSTIGHPLTIKGVGGLAHLKAADPIPNGKAILVVNADVTLENIMFTDARVPDRNGAGIRHESGDLVIRNSVFQNNENGILSAPNASASLTIRDSEFIGNGHGDGRSHGIYVNQIASLDVEGSTFRDTNVGHHIKSRAQETIVRDSTLDDGQGDASYSIDLPNGGRAILEDNTLIQTNLSENPAMVAYGAEGNLHSQNSLLIKNNTFIDNHANGKGIYNHTDTVVTLQGNTFQDVETEIVGPHEFIDTGAANPVDDDETVPAEDTTNSDPANDEAANEDLADDSTGDDLANDGSTNNEVAGGEPADDGSVDDETVSAEDTTNSDPASDEAANEDLADDSPNKGDASDEAANEDLADDSSNDDEAVNDTLGDGSPANDGLADDNSADGGFPDDTGAETADDPTDAPYRGFLPEHLFEYTTKNGYHGILSNFYDIFADAHDGSLSNFYDRFADAHEGRNEFEWGGSVGDWWFDFC